MRIWIVASGVFLAGCDLIFPLTEPDPATAEVTGTIMHRFVEMSADVMPEIGALPATDTVLRVRFENGAEESVPIATDGSFRFGRSSTAYTLEVALGASSFDLIESSPHLTLGDSTAGRRDTIALQLPTTITLPPPATLTPVLATTGQWTQTLLNVPVLDWRKAGQSGGRTPGLLSGTKRDILYYLEFDTDIGTMQTSIKRMGLVSDLEMVDGDPIDLQTMPVMATMPNGCARVESGLEPVVIRLEAATSTIPSVMPTTRTWAVTSVPAIDTGLAGSINLIGAGVNTLDFVATAPYFDPFPGHELLVAAGASSGRTVTVPGTTTGARLDSSYSQFVQIAHAQDCLSSAALLEPLDVPFVTGVTINNMLVVADSQSIPAVRPGNTIVTWETDGGLPDVFDVALFEVVAVEAETRFERRGSFRTRMPSIALADELLLAGHHYILSFVSTKGVPGASDGDYMTVDYPTAFAVTHSPMFTAN